MRNAVSLVLVGCVFATTQLASASPFGNTRSDTSDETGTTPIKFDKKKKAAKPKAKPAKKAPKQASDEDIIVIDEPAPKKAANTAKKSKPSKAPKQASDEEIIIIEEPAPKAKPAKRAPKQSDDDIVIVDSDKKAKTKPAKAPKQTSDDDIVIVDDEETRPAKATRATRDEDPLPTRKVAITDTGDAEVDEVAPVRLTKSAGAKRATRFYFRAGGFKQSSKLGATEFGLQTDLPIDTSNLGAGSGVVMEQSQIPFQVIVGYVLPVLKGRMSVETVLGFPTKTKFKATGALANESLAPTFMGMQTGIEPLGPDIGEATFAPPMVTAVYRIAELGRVTPIAGAGLMLLMARGAKITNPVLNEAGDPKLSFTPSPGLVLQTGAEVRLTKRVAARLDIKYVVGMKVKAKIEDIAVTPKAIPGIGSIEVGDAVLSAKVTPLVVTAGVGADF